MLTNLKSSVVRSGRRAAGVLKRVADQLTEKDPVHYTRLLESGDVVWRAFVDAGKSLAKCGRFEEADRMLERGLAAFPNDPGLLYEYAFCAHQSGAYAAAVERWGAALKAAPDLPMCHCGLAANLRVTGQFAKAQTVIDAATETFGDDLLIVTEAARIAEVRGRFDEALRLWRIATDRPNPHPDWLQGEAHALVLLGRFAEAQSVLSAARARHPGTPGLLAVEGILAAAREDWSRAVTLWTGYRQRFPDDKTGWEHLGRAQHALALSEAADRAKAAHVVPSVQKVDDDSLRELLLGFESIGDNCEFGSVQRRYSAEPLGLLRWNKVTIDGLISGLAQHLDGMGEEANTELSKTPNGEFIVQDRRWGLSMHTFLFEGQVERGALYPKMCRRIAYLKDKFVADLKSADKIFVFRSVGLDGDRLEALHRALSAFGPVRLLNVQPAAPTAPTTFQGRAGDLVKVEDKRYVGFLERLGVAEGGYWDIAFDDWISVCRKTVARA